MKRVFNFAAGPAALPLEVLEKAQSELSDFKGTGMSVMEMSHRSKEYQSVIDSAEATLRELLNIPSNYKVLFLQGGASMQFTMVPMNLMSEYKKAYYVDSGSFANKAAKEAKLFGEVKIAASSKADNYVYIPDVNASLFTEKADYVHITSNNTIYGTHFAKTPDVGGLPLVSDMSSCILSEVIDVSDYALIYAGAQKNIGPAGVTLVIIREDMIGKVSGLPAMMDYAVAVENGSMYNTPPTFAIYLAGLVFDDLKKKGGVPAIQKINEEKAALLYGFLDQSKLFKGTCEKAARSKMNVTFVTGNKETDAKFVAAAEAAGLCNLQGHRLVGGMRASIYNAVSLEAVEALVAFMGQFEKENA